MKAQGSLTDEVLKFSRPATPRLECTPGLSLNVNAGRFSLQSPSIRIGLMILIVLAVLPALGIILHSGFDERRRDVAEAEEKILRTVENIARHQETLAISTRQMLMTIAQYPEVHKGDTKFCSNLFQKLIEKSPFYGDIIATTPEGAVFASAVTDTTFSLADRDYFGQVVASQEFSIGEHIVSRSNQISSLPFAYPILEKGQLKALLVATVRLDQYANILNLAGFPQGSIVGIEDRNGARLFRYPTLHSSQTNGVNGKVPKSVWKIISKGPRQGLYTETGGDGVRRIYGYSQFSFQRNNKPDLYIRVGIPETSAYLPAQIRLRWNLLLFSIASIFALSAGWFLGNLTLVNPLRRLALLSSKIGKGEYSLRSGIPHAKGGEIGLLAHSFDRMANTLETREIERKKFEATLQELHKRHQLILNAAEEGIVGVDEKGIIVFINPAAASMTGYDARDLLGQKFHEMIHHARKDGTPYPINMCPVYATLQNGTSTRSYNELLWRKNGSCFPVFYASTPIMDEGNLSGAVITFRDISKLKQAEAALEDSEKRFRLLIENISDIILVLDRDGRISYASPSIVRILDYSPDEIIGKLTCDFVHPEDLLKILDIFGKCLISPDIFVSSTARARHKNGTWHFFEIAGKSLQGDTDDSSMIINARDITEKIRDEEEKEKLHAQFIQAQKMESVGRLAGGVAHDFNNMLSVIIGHTGMLQHTFKNDEDASSSLNEIKKAALLSADLTRQLLTFARKQTISPKILDLNEVIGNILKMLQRLIGENIDLAWLPGESIWPIKIDPAQIDQILVNLVVNARDAIVNTGAITIETANVCIGENQVHPYANFSGKSFVQIAVSDNGGGIPPEVVENIFEPFFTTKELGKGTGLGLATVYGVVKQNNGFINVYSEPGLGTTFKIYLPPMKGSVPKERAGIGHYTLQGDECILMVEDEPSVLRCAKRALEGYGYTVLATSYPADALRLAHEYHGTIDLLITDLIMPGMNGKELSQKFKEVRPTCRTIFWSGYTPNSVIHGGILEEGVHFLQKPFTNEALAEKIRDVL